MAYNPHHISNNFLPVVDDQKLRRIILHMGENMIHRTKGTRCTDCWDELSQTADPECSSCSGSNDGYEYTDRLVKGVLIQRDSHAIYNVDNLKTVAGFNERADFDLYVDRLTGIDIREDDVLIFERNNFLDDVEFIVMNKKLFGGSGKKIAGWRLLLFKTPVVDSIAPKDGRRL